MGEQKKKRDPLSSSTSTTTTSFSLFSLFFPFHALQKEDNTRTIETRGSFLQMKKSDTTMLAKRKC